MSRWTWTPSYASTRCSGACCECILCRCKTSQIGRTVSFVDRTVFSVDVCGHGIHHMRPHSLAVRTIQTLHRPHCMLGVERDRVWSLCLSVCRFSVSVSGCRRCVAPWAVCSSVVALKHLVPRSRAALCGFVRCTLRQREGGRKGVREGGGACRQRCVIIFLRADPPLTPYRLCRPLSMLVVVVVAR